MADEFKEGILGNIDEILGWCEPLRQAKLKYFDRHPNGLTLINTEGFAPDDPENSLKMFNQMSNPRDGRPYPTDLEGPTKRIWVNVIPCLRLMKEYGSKELEERRVQELVWSENPDSVNILVREFEGFREVVKNLPAATLLAAATNYCMPEPENIQQPQNGEPDAGPAGKSRRGPRLSEKKARWRMKILEDSKRADAAGVLEKYLQENSITKKELKNIVDWDRNRRARRM